MGMISGASGVVRSVYPMVPSEIPQSRVSYPRNVVLVSEVSAYFPYYPLVPVGVSSANLYCRTFGFVGCPRISCVRDGFFSGNRDDEDRSNEVCVYVYVYVRVHACACVCVYVYV